MTNTNVSGMMPANTFIQKWVNEMAAMCQPENIYWCDGSEDEKERLTQIAVQTVNSYSSTKKNCLAVICTAAPSTTWRGRKI